MLVIFAIPVLFLLIFLVQNWYVLAAFLVILAIVVYALFRRK